MVTAVWNESERNLKLYINGSFNVNGSDGETNFAGATWDYDALICAYRTGGYNDDFIGGIDELAIWNRTLSPTEITQLWDSGTGMNYSDMTAGGNSILYLYDLYSNEQILNFSANWGDGWYNTSTGSITTNFESRIVNITFNSSGYNDSIYNNTNITTTYTAYIINDSLFNLTVNIYSYVGVAMPNITVWSNHTNNTNYTNPFTENILSYISISQPELNISLNISDNNTIHDDMVANLTISGLCL